MVYIKSVIKTCDVENTDDANESFENLDDDPDYTEVEEITQSSFKRKSPSSSPTPTLPQLSTSPSHEDDKNNQILSSSSSSLLTSTNDDISKLIKRKQELEMKTKQHEIYQQKLENLLENSCTIFHIEVKPKYLIPDTNCFIDFLQMLKTIINLNSKRFILTIPTVVCNELEGLSKGFKISNITTLQATSSKIRHFDEVTIRAREALEFIKCKKYFNLKYVTTKGSILNTSNFIVEDDDDDDYNNDGDGDDNNFENYHNLNGTTNMMMIMKNGTYNVGNGKRKRNRSKQNSNDDRILQTALNLCHRTNIEKKLKNKIFIQTECVLLTTDRNLRVKALSRNLSVSQLKEFISWANLFEN